MDVSVNPRYLSPGDPSDNIFNTVGATETGRTPRPNVKAVKAVKQVRAIIWSCAASDVHAIPVAAYLRFLKLPGEI